MKLAEASKERFLLGEVLRRQYHPDTAAMVTSAACALLGHLPKYDKPFDEKAEWEQGCCCTARPWI